MDDRSWIPAQWPAPDNVIAGITTRLGGHSQGVFDSLNLAQHVGDDKKSVNENRQELSRYLALPSEPRWLEQVHGCEVVTASATDSSSDSISSTGLDKADACITRVPGQVCVVMTADCLPVLITDKDGQYVAAVHAGWRGLEQQIILRSLEKLPVAPESLLVWLGPAIGANVFEVGSEVRDRFLTQNDHYLACFKSSSNPGKWLMDMYAIARLQLATAQVGQVFGGDFCTYTDAERFYSYRRDQETGRMASLIWIRDQA